MAGWRQYFRYRYTYYPSSISFLGNIRWTT